MRPPHLEIDRRSRTPIGVQLSRQMAWMIAAGRLVEGDRLPAVRSLADELGINLHTVRAAYRHLAEDGLVSTTHGKGTFVLPFEPGHPARAFIGQLTATFGIIIPAHTDLFSRVIEGAEQVAAEAASLVVTASARETQATGLAAAERLVANGVEGLAVIAPMVGTAEVERLRVRLGNLVVCDWPGAPGPGVRFDLAGGITAAVDHLVGHGHTRIGLVAPPADWENATEIHAAFTAARPGEGHLVTLVHNYSVEAGYRAGGVLLGAAEPPTAVIACDDKLAFGIAEAARERGVSVPGDLALIGMGDQAIGRAARPQLTTIDLPARRMGGEALRLLLAGHSGVTVPADHVTLETALTIRESCGCPEPRSPRPRPG